MHAHDASALSRYDYNTASNMLASRRAVERELIIVLS